MESLGTFSEIFVFLISSLRILHSDEAKTASEMLSEIRGEKKMNYFSIRVDLSTFGRNE